MGMASATVAALLEVSPGASVEVLPPAVPGRLDVAVHANRLPLDADRLSQDLRAIDVDAWSVGDGTWFVAVHLPEPASLLAEPAPGGFRLVVAPPRDPEAAPEGLDVLLADTATRRAEPPPRRPLVPLGGSAASYPVPVEAWTLGFAPPRADGLDPHVRIAEARRRLPDPAARRLLGEAHLDLGLYREAAYYLESALASAPADPRTVLLAATARVALGDWRAATGHCRVAATLAAERGQVYGCLGLAALATGRPAPTPIARVLAGLETPAARLLAGLLFLRDNRHADAARVLDGVELAGELAPLAALALGDALYGMAGDPLRADAAWARAGHDPRWRDVADLRRRMGRMVAGGPRTWGRDLPELVSLSERPDRAGAEATWLLLQVAEVHGDWQTASEHAGALWRFHPALARKADVPERLLRATTRRVEALLAVDRPVEALAEFETSWREELDRALVDPGLLFTVARTATGLGLSERALALHRRGMDVEVRAGRETLDAVLVVARLYARVGRTVEARDALAFARKMAAGTPRERDVDLALAARLASDGEVDEARRLWARFPGPVSERWTALLDHDCARLVALVDPPGSPDGPDRERLALARLRCLATRGPKDEALALAASLRGVVPDEEIDAALGTPAGTTLAARIAKEDEQHEAWSGR